MKIAVVGGGIVGLSTAFELSARGHNVHVFDPNPASGASYFAGGMLAPAAEVQFQQDPLFPLMRRAGKLWPDMVRRVAQHTNLPTGYRTDGTLVVAADRADAEHLKQLHATQEAAGMDVRPITTRQARGLEPALGPRLSAAVHIPNDTQVAPRVFLTALLDALDDCGVEVMKENHRPRTPLPTIRSCCPRSRPRRTTPKPHTVSTTTRARRHPTSTNRTRGSQHGCARLG